jgi:tetratricopeptide (TPR) repeat protein
MTRRTFISGIGALCIAALALGAGVVSAQDAAVIAAPPAARLDGLTLVYQDINRCSAAALATQLTYFEDGIPYTEAINALNPHNEDVAVRLDEMAAFARGRGLGAVDRLGGTPDLLKALVANGFPVLIENSYYDGADYQRDWMSHNRVVMGYDDATQNFYTFDPLLGAGEDRLGRPIPYADLDTRWRPFNRDYLVIYRPEDEPTVRAILGESWDAYTNAQIALAQSQAEIEAGEVDSFTYFNLGSSLALLGRYAESADAFDRARQNGLPWRMFWYQYGAFEAYYHTARYDDVLALARDVIAATPGVEEVYYYAGLAYEAQGDFVRAQGNYEVAAWRNPSFVAASAGLARLRGDTAIGG